MANLVKCRQSAKRLVPNIYWFAIAIWSVGTAVALQGDNCSENQRRLVRHHNMASFRTAAADYVSHNNIFLILLTGAIALFAFYAWFRTTKTRLFPGAPYTGLADGTRSLAEARRRYQTHAAEMLVEGYKKVCRDPPHGGLSVGDRSVLTEHRPMAASTTCQDRTAIGL